jgi:hypothetical protein
LDPNPWGFYDMHGNVFEWCRDWRGDGYYQYCVDNVIVEDPPGPPADTDGPGTHRILRGGPYLYDATFQRSSKRSWGDGTTGDVHIGFRGVLDPQSIVALGLVGHWKLDEQTGETSASDSAPLANDGTVVGGARWRPWAGPVDGALEMNGSDQYVSVPNESYYDLTTGISVCAWIKSPGFLNDWAAIVTKGDSAWRLQRDGTNHVVVFTPNGADVAASTTVVDNSKWYHIVGTSDGSNVQLFVNGVREGAASRAAADVQNNHEVRIGSNAEQAGRSFNGMIDEVRIYDRVLTHKEVKALHSAGR